MTKEKIEWVGVDGCKSGWFYIAIDKDKGFSFGVEKRFSVLAEKLGRAKLILVDIPIGLPSSHRPRRVCDEAARKAISPRGSSVFPAPARSALTSKTYEKACEVNKRILGKKLTLQSWAIAPKIREVDDFLQQTSSSGRVREMHPEVAFWALNYERPLVQKKKKPAGQQERIKILSRHYPRAAECFEACKIKYLRKEVAKDDILDAMVGAVTAMQFPNIASLPPNPVFDETGLPMEIVYAKTGLAPSEAPELRYDELESAAAETLGRIIFALTRLEFNLALALRFAVANPGEEKFELWEDKLNFKDKLDNLRKIVTNRFLSDSECVSEFSAWYSNMDLVRKKRNALVHGRWGVSPGKQRVLNVSKDFPGVGEDGVTEFSLGALRRELDDIERLDREFGNLRVKWNSFWPKEC